jgi:hypothetical protein
MQLTVLASRSWQIPSAFRAAVRNCVLGRPGGNALDYWALIDHPARGRDIQAGLENKKPWLWAQSNGFQCHLNVSPRDTKSQIKIAVALIDLWTQKRGGSA